MPYDLNSLAFAELLKPKPVNAAEVILSPGQNVSDAQLRRASRLEAERRAENDPSIVESYMAATRLESTTVSILGMVEESGFEIDPNYALPLPDSDEWKDLTKDIPRDFWGSFSDSLSADHAQFLRERILQEMDATRTLQDDGWAGVGMRLGRAIVDEGAIALTFATAGVAAPFVYGPKIARLAKFLRLGALSAAENSILEGILMKSQETKDASDFIYAALGGFALGGAVGALSKTEKVNLNRVINRAANHEDLITLNEAGIFGAGRPVRSPMVDEILDRLGKQEIADADDVDFAAASRSVGSAQVDPDTVPRLLRDETPEAEILATPQLSKARGSIRFDGAARLARSDNPYVRWFGRNAIADPVGVRGEVNEIAVEEVANFLRQGAMVTFSRQAKYAVKDWMQANGIPVGQRTQASSAFFEAVTDAVRRQDFTDPHIGRAARGLMASIRKIAQDAKAAGVKGFDTVDVKADFIPRILSHEKIALRVDKFGSGQIERLIAKAIRGATDLSATRAAKIAKGYLQKVRRVGAGLESDLQFALKDKDMLAQAMRDAGIADDEIADALGAVQFGKDKGKAGKIARAKRRLSMDETVTLRLKNQAGEMEEVALSSLFENDARLLLNLYTRQVTGHTAFAKQMGFTSRADFELLKKRAIAYAHDRAGGRAVKNLKKDIKRLQFYYDVITGKGADQTDLIANLGGAGIAKGARVIRDINFVRIMNASGFSQIAELGNLMSLGGFRNFISQMPELWRMVRRVKATGKIPDDVADELEVIIPLGTDRLRNNVPSRFDSGLTDELEPVLTSSFGKRLDIGLDTAKRVTADISGLAPITVITQRMASKAIAQNFVNTAWKRGGKTISINRMRSMGVSDEMAERIFKQIKRHTVTVEGTITGRKIKSLNFDKWDDLDARDTFSLAVFRQGRRIIQENDLGSATPFISSTTGKLLIQFRSFIINAYSKQLLHNVEMRDFDAFAAFAASMAWAATAYTMRQQVYAIGLKDRKKRLAKRLAVDEIAKAAFQNAGFASLIPAAVDSIWQTFGNEPVFSYGRSTGLGTSLFDPKGNPSGQTITSFADIPAMLGGGVTRGEARRMSRLLPFNNAVGVKNIIDILTEDMPKSRRRK